MKDYSEYFKKPSLHDAKKRTKEEVKRYNDAFYIPDEMIGIGKNKKYFIHTYGCQANERDTETLSGILEMMSYQESKDIKDADIILLNTCAIRENAEEKVFGKVGYVKNLKKTNPDLIFGMCGCMELEEVVINRILEKHPQLDLIFGTHNIHQLPALLKEANFAIERIIEVWSKEGDVIENVPVNRANPFKAWVNIMYGCDKFCTYCIVPYTRGKERSRNKEDIIQEVEELVKTGYQEITLLGQNVNSYGKDIDTTYSFANLLEDVAKTNIPRIRFTTSHPWDFSEEMIRIIATYDNIMPAIHLPVQSGNNQVLKLMGRRYTREKYLDLFHKIKKHIPDCTVTTDVIVGFPNETHEQYLDTISLYKECEYDLAYTFVYSPRAGTPAAKMKDNVSSEEKNQRLYDLNEIVNENALRKNQRFLNKEVEVLVEGASKKDDTMLTGYTKHQKLVNFKGNPEDIGKIIKVKITEVKTWALKGEAIG
ncbi:MAG: tRNA (N6-isopentenyl adenosine(37)-C2)-methylthiotransferase MiaB [Coprobacillaceae bacterium]